MNVDINIYTVHVSGGYHEEAKPYIQALYDLFPNKRCEKGAWSVGYYQPKSWKPEAEGQDWKAYAEANPTPCMRLTRAGKRSSLIWTKPSF